MLFDTIGNHNYYSQVQQIKECNHFLQTHKFTTNYRQVIRENHKSKNKINTLNVLIT